MSEDVGGPAGAAADGGDQPLPRGLAVFRRTLRAVGHAELAVAVAAFVAVVVLNVIQVTLRAFETSIFWVQEVSQLLALVAYFIGASSLFRSRHYIIIEFLVQRLGPALQRQIYFLAQLLAIVFCAIIVIESIQEVPLLLTNYSVILHLPKLYSHLPLIVGSASIVVTSVYYGLAVWTCGRRRPDLGVADLEKLVIAA